jgi:HPt (histidine-containing phosphotransfer) domain-containing protein
MLKQASLQNRPLGVPFSLLDREGKRVWLVIPTEEQLQKFRQAFPEADVHHPPWAEVFVRVSRRGMSSAEMEKLAVPAIMNSLAPAATEVATDRAPARQTPPAQVAGVVAKDRAPSVRIRDSHGPVVSMDREVDWPGALAQMNGDEKQLHDVVGVFLSEINGMLERVRDAIESRDGPLLRCAAQSLRESLAYIKATHCYELASRLEELGRGGDLSEVGGIYTQLEKRLGRVKRELASFTRIRTGRR